MARQSRTDKYRLALDAARAAAFDELVDRLGRRERPLPACLACGRALAALRPDGAGYGSGWVDDLRGALGGPGVAPSRSLVYRLLRFADLYPGDAGAAEVLRLGGRVSWEVMTRLIPVEDDATREGILRRAAEEGLSSREVIDLVREAGEYGRPWRGRPPSPADASTHPHQALRRLRALAARWPAVYAAWAGGRGGALARAGRLRPAQVTPALLADLDAVVPALGEMARAAGDLAGRLVDVLAALRARDAGRRPAGRTGAARQPRPRAAGGP